MKITYLASPYSHSDRIVRSDRAELASLVAAHLMRADRCVYSPTSHGHPVSFHMPFHTDHEFWMAQCLPILQLSDELVVLPQEGWRESRGVWEELEFARIQSIPIYFLQDMPPGFSHRIELLDDEELKACNWHRTYL